MNVKSLHSLTTLGAHLIGFRFFLFLMNVLYVIVQALRVLELLSAHVAREYVGVLIDFMVLHFFDTNKVLRTTLTFIDESAVAA